MSSIEIEKTLYRIIQGRLRYKVHDDFVLYIHEPTPELIFTSYEVYDDAYEIAYRKGSYVQAEILPILLENGYWSPLDDKEAENIQKEVDEVKVQCFQNFFKSKILAKLKRKLRFLEKKYSVVATKKSSLHSITCEGAADLARMNWLISKTTKFEDGTLYDWSNASLLDVVSFWQRNQIPVDMIRQVAKNDLWKGMWTGGKGTEIFGVPFTRISQNQSRLCMFAKMYDSVYEHPESPKEAIVNDDDCLDGWFIFQKRKSEKEKKQSEIDGMITNEKIRNSDEFYVVAQNREDASQIYDINDPTARNIIRERDEKITGKEGMKFTELNDVQRQLQIERNKKFTDTMRSNRT